MLGKCTCLCEKNSSVSSKEKKRKFEIESLNLPQYLCSHKIENIF